MARWGHHEASYTELSVAEQQTLQKALRLVTYGLYSEAKKVFDDEILRQCPNPIVAVEKSHLYHLMGLDFKVLDILMGIETPQDRLCPDHGSDIWDLVALLRFEANALIHGKLRPAVDFAQSVNQRLASKNDLEHTDVETHCMFVCKRLLSHGSKYSNWLENSNPVSQVSKEAPKSLDELILALEQVRDQVSGNGEHGAPLVEELSLENQANEEDINEATLFTSCLTKIKAAEKLAKEEKYENSLRELEPVESLIAAAMAAHNLDGRYFRHLRMREAKVRLSLDRQTELQQLCRLHINLSDEAFELSSFRNCRQLLLAALKLSQKFQEQATTTNDSTKAQELRKAIVAKLLALEEQHTRSSYNLASFLLSYAHHLVLVSESQGAEFARMVKDFEAAFPDFGFPKLAYNLTRSAMRCYVSMGNEEEAVQYRTKSSFWLEQCPRDMSENALFHDDVNDEDAWRVWAVETFESETWIEDYQNVCATLMHRWVLRELELEKVNLDEAQRLLRFGAPTIETAPSLLEGSHCYSPDNNAAEDTSSQVLTMKDMKSISPPALAKTLFGRPEPLKAQTWDPWFRSVEEWLRTPDRGPSKMQRELLLRQISMFRVSGIVKFLSSHMAWMSPEEEHEWLRLQYLESVECLRVHRSIDPELIAGNQLDRALWNFAKGTVSFAAHPGMDRNSGPSDNDLNEAIKIFSEIFLKQKTAKRLQPAHRTMSSIARATWIRYLFYRTVDAWACLPFWAEADRLYQEMRLEHRALSNSSAFTAKERLASAMQQTNHRKHAILAALHSIEDFSKASPDIQKTWGGTEKWIEILDSLVEFVQRSKAQSLTDLLGRRIKPPQSVIKAVLKHPSARQKWEDRETLLAEIAQTSFLSKRIELQAKVDSHTAELRDEFPVLVPFLDIEMGEAISAPELQKFGQELGSSVVMVEWIEILNRAYDLLLIVYREGVISSATQVRDLKLTDVNKWVAEHLDEPEETAGDDPPLSQRHAKRDLNELRPLVAPLEDLTTPGETLVFSPTLSLHRVPLHALTIGKPIVSLIERNPIVYAQSLSLLRMCHSSQVVEARDGEPSIPFNATVFNTLEWFQTQQDEADTTTSVLALCDLLGANLVYRPEDRKGAFKEECARSNIIHVHGHADFELKPRLAHYLKLRDPSVDTSDQLTVEEIFELQFARPSLVLAMGCNTGRARISPTNDLLGLTAAFHLAGAGTVISTLWRIDRRDCMQFSKVFYTELLERSYSDSPEEVTVDLARAFRKAILNLRKDEDGKGRKPYHWAGFTLHGAWLFPRFTFDESAGSPT